LKQNPKTMKKLFFILFIVAGITAAKAQTTVVGTLVIPYGSAQDTTVISKTVAEVKSYRKLAVATKGSIIQSWVLTYTSGKTNGTANGTGDALTRTATTMLYNAKADDTFVIDMKVTDSEGVMQFVSRKFVVK
jgi:hypothetical protein